MKRLQLFILWVCTICFPAVSHDYMFKHLEVKDGLSNNQVNAIYKDSNGFMWFGTASGLNRYDGYDVKIYRSQKDDMKSLPDNYIETIQEDGAGNLWILTGAGYAIYNSGTDSFDRNVGAWMWNIGIDGVPSKVYIDTEKAYWLFMAGKGVYRYKTGMKAAERVKLSLEELSGGGITSMVECDEGILMAYDDGTLSCIDKEKLELKWVNRDIPAELETDEVNTFDLFADRDGRVWVYSVIGVWIYDLPRKTWELRSPRSDTYNIVRALAQDKYGNIWVGRDQDGIDVIDKNRQHTHLANDPNNERTLSNNTITSLYEDVAGTMWVGTYKKGV